MAERTSHAKMAGNTLIIFGVILTLAFTFGQLNKGRRSDERGTPAAPAHSAAANVSTTSVSGRTIAAGTTCKPWSRTPQTCTFDHVPTAGFGQREHGSRFCMDIPHGANESFRLQRASGVGFVDFAEGGEPRGTVIRITRFVGNHHGAPVTVTYWLGGPEGCGAPALSPQPPTQQAVPPEQLVPVSYPEPTPAPQVHWTDPEADPNGTT